MSAPVLHLNNRVLLYGRVLSADGVVIWQRTETGAA